jgi:hypothetical protein
MLRVVGQALTSTGARLPGSVLELLEDRDHSIGATRGLSLSLPNGRVEGLRNTPRGAASGTAGRGQRAAGAVAGRNGLIRVFWKEVYSQRP